MIKLTRPPEPDFLRKNAATWGEEYAAKREQNPSAQFRWKSPVYNLLIEALEPMCGEHCSFCDGFPLGSASRKTIEHFRPTSKFPLLVYSWPNLFFACDACQQAKLGKFDEKLLKPDEADYEFETYFMLDYKTGEIQANPRAETSDQERAIVTIEMYKLNEYGRPHIRLSEYKKYLELSKSGWTIDEFSYRYFLM